MKIAIIGGGIGGLFAALHLLKAGLDVHVYEQSPRIGEIGAGIQISPNASRLLIRLGLKPALDAVGVRPLAVHQRRWDDGRTLQRAPVGPEVEATFGAPYYHFHRGDLAELLGAAVPAERLHVGHRLVGLEQQGERVVARFENAASAESDSENARTPGRSDQRSAALRVRLVVRISSTLMSGDAASPPSTASAIVPAPRTAPLRRCTAIPSLLVP